MTDKYTRNADAMRTLADVADSHGTPLERPKAFRATLPLPVSTNDMHIRSRYGVVLSASCRAYYARMKALLPALWPYQPWHEERLRLEYTLHESDMRRRDVSNYVKSLQDALEGFIYANDSQLDEVVCRRGELREVPEVYVVVSVIEDPLVRTPLKKVKKARDEADAEFATKQAKMRAMRLAGLKKVDIIDKKKKTTPRRKK